jgi:hypothetical protein
MDQDKTLTEHIHKCGTELAKSIRSTDFLICRKCMVDVPLTEVKKNGSKK